MRSYRWDLHNSVSIFERYPFALDPMVGGASWRDGAASFRNPAYRRRPIPVDQLRAWLERLVVEPGVQQFIDCPRVFISHRQTDLPLAVQVAYAAHSAGFDYWLDVVDLRQDKPPFVVTAEATLGRPLTEVELSFLTATIIEMALLNCTHVITLMSVRTAGSQWVSYEYGRVKQRVPKATNAAAWLDTRTLHRSALPEYLELSPIHARQSELRAWFAAEFKGYPGCDGPTPRDPWTEPIPESLPNEDYS